MEPLKQHCAPGADKEANWLPAANGRFSRYIRAYWARKACGQCTSVSCSG